jgi:hypothetical protein
MITDILLRGQKKGHQPKTPSHVPGINVKQLIMKEMTKEH